jgi:NAD(P)-dependent dehydrogenase (short-subunit alcohol dehydrogenase family)
LAIVRHLLEKGTRVVAADRDPAACATASAELQTDAVRFVVADIGTIEGAKAAIDTGYAQFGSVDLLCNNAAYHPLEAIESHRLETWRECFRVNVDGAMLCSQAAVAVMREQGHGTIVNMGSVSGTSPYATGGAYAASKAALAMLTKALALEVGAYGITVNCIAAGSIRHRPGNDPDAAAPHIPMGYHGSPKDVAALIEFLASPHGRYITGSILTLDGGATAGRVRVR